MKNVRSVFVSYTNKSLDELAKEFSVSLTQGLSDQEVATRREKYGFNEMTSHEIGWQDVLIRQLKSPFIYLLLGVACVSFFLQNHFDAIVILCVVCLNTFFGFFQEYRASKALAFLKHYIFFTSKVLRNGKEVELQSKELVPGDIIVFYPGDIIPADVRFIEDQNLTVDESALTGESLPIKKVSGVLAGVHEIFKAFNIGFSGTTILSGKGKAIVFATGSSTTLGDIAVLTGETVRVTSFAKGIAQFSTFIIRLMVISLVTIIAANLLIKGTNVNLIELILFACALAVSVIPEALPIVTMFALSQGAVRLANLKAVVKRLSAIEDLGNVEVLCSDKTGTLTENISKVEGIYGDQTRNILLLAALMVTDQEKSGHTSKGFDGALYTALTPDEQKTLESYQKIAEIPFDPQRRSSAILVKKDGTVQLISRGASETILAQCQLLDDEKKATIKKWITDEGLQARRVIALAKKEIPGAIPQGRDLHDQEVNMEFLGMVSFGDPLKKTALAAVKKARDLNVEIKILSGDAAEVCGAIAYQVGLVKDYTEVITGDVFAQYSDEKKYEAVNKYAVFARVSPQQKYEIVTLLQRDRAVAYVGDGINDAPALKVANVALAVQDAAGIAREAADIILLKKSMMVIVDGIEEGRKVFANTLKYIRTTLSSTFGNFYSVALVSLFLDYLPLLPVQLLLINFLSDFPMLSIATDNVKAAELKRPAKYDIHGIILIATVLGFVCSVFDFIFFARFHRLPAAVVQTSWFILNIVTAVSFIYSIRTAGPFYKASLPSRLLVILSLAVVSFSVMLPYTSFGQNFFYFVPLTSMHLIWIASIAVAYFLTTDVVKLMYYRMLEKRNGQAK